MQPHGMRTGHKNDKPRFFNAGKKQYLSTRATNIRNLTGALDTDLVAGALGIRESVLVDILSGRESGDNYMPQIQDRLRQVGLPINLFDRMDARFDERTLNKLREMAGVSENKQPTRRSNFIQVVQAFDGRTGLLADALDVIESSIMAVVDGRLPFDDQRFGHMNPRMMQAGFPDGWLDAPNARLLPAYVAGLERIASDSYESFFADETPKAYQEETGQEAEVAPVVEAADFELLDSAPASQEEVAPAPAALEQAAANYDDAQEASFEAPAASDEVAEEMPAAASQEEFELELATEPSSAPDAAANDASVDTQPETSAAPVEEPQLAEHSRPILSAPKRAHADAAQETAQLLPELDLLASLPSQAPESTTSSMSSTMSETTQAPASAPSAEEEPGSMLPPGLRRVGRPIVFGSRVPGSRVDQPVRVLSTYAAAPTVAHAGEHSPAPVSTADTVAVAPTVREPKIYSVSAPQAETAPTPATAPDAGTAQEPALESAPTKTRAYRGHPKSGGLTKEASLVRAHALDTLLAASRRGVRVYLWRDLMDMGKSGMSYWSNIKAGKIRLRDELADKVTERLGLPKGWLDDGTMPPATHANWLFDASVPLPTEAHEVPAEIMAGDPAMGFVFAPADIAEAYETQSEAPLPVAAHIESKPDSEELFEATAVEPVAPQETAAQEIPAPVRAVEPVAPAEATPVRAPAPERAAASVLPVGAVMPPATRLQVTTTPEVSDKSATAPTLGMFSWAPSRNLPNSETGPMSRALASVIERMSREGTFSEEDAMRLMTFLLTTR